MAQQKKYNDEANETFAIPELLESVLLNLPTKSLIQAQRVAKPWFNLIKSSPKLQQNLFFKPLPVEEAWMLGYQPSLTLKYEGIIHPVMAVDFNKPTEVNVDKAQSHTLPVTLNELLVFQPLLYDSQPEYTLSIRCEYGERVKLDLSPVDRNASCRKMFLSQPPTNEIELILLSKDHSHEKKLLVRNEDGVRFEDILDQSEGLKSRGSLYRRIARTARLPDIICPSKEERADIKQAMRKVQALPR